MHLTEDDLKEWTGAKQRSRIITFLDEKRIPYWIGADGEVRSTQTLWEKAMTGTEQRAVRDNV